MEEQEHGDLLCDPAMQELPRAEGRGEMLRKTISSQVPLQAQVIIIIINNNI